MEPDSCCYRQSLFVKKVILNQHIYIEGQVDGGHKSPHYIMKMTLVPNPNLTSIFNRQSLPHATCLFFLWITHQTRKKRAGSILSSSLFLLNATLTTKFAKTNINIFSYLIRSLASAYKTSTP